jgi:hypothetical protein
MSWNASRKKSNKGGTVPVQIASQVKLWSQNIAIDSDVIVGVQSKHNTMASACHISTVIFTYWFWGYLTTLFQLEKLLVCSK